MLVCILQVLRNGGSTLLVLSLVTSNLWDAVVHKYVFPAVPELAVSYFLLAILCEIAGIGLYLWSGQAERMGGWWWDAQRGASASVQYDRLAMADETRSAVLGACAEMRDGDEVRGHLIDRSGFPAESLWSSHNRCQQGQDQSELHGIQSRGNDAAGPQRQKLTELQPLSGGPRQVVV